MPTPVHDTSDRVNASPDKVFGIRDHWSIFVPILALFPLGGLGDVSSARTDAIIPNSFIDQSLWICDSSKGGKIYSTYAAAPNYRFAVSALNRLELGHSTNGSPRP